MDLAIHSKPKSFFLLSANVRYQKILDAVQEADIEIKKQKMSAEKVEMNAEISR